MRNRLRDHMLYSAGSPDGHSRGGESYGYQRTTEIHQGTATEEKIAELRKRFEDGRDLWTGEKL